jgi:[acyl-carrier-protein] S-malonyltransferase
MTTGLTAGIFPGQGSQAVGMGQELAAAEAIVRETFAEADTALGFAISTLCFDGPADELKRTSVAQPALVTMSTALWRLLASRGQSLDVAAGHSLGEYSALVAAGALAFTDAVTLVRARGLLMEEAAAAQPGGMAAIIGMDDAAVVELCAAVAAEHGTLVPANYNSPGQVVVSGESAAIAAVRAAAKERGARAIPLAVSGPFHSPLMQPAADAFAAVLAAVPLAAPRIPVIPNVTAVPTTDPAALRDALARQITGSVRWTDTLFAMRDMGVGTYLEIGPGNVLVGLVQRTLPDTPARTATDALAG